MGKSLTHFPKLKRALRKAELRKRGGHSHPAYDVCGDECKKAAEKLNGEILKLQNRKNKINGIVVAPAE